MPAEPDAGLPAPDDEGGASLRRCFVAALAVLKPLVSLTQDHERLLVACELGGFPLAVRRVVGESDLPAAFVVGRHGRCTLPLPDGSRASLRHLLLSMSAGGSPPHIRGYDLGGRGGVTLADGKRVEGFAAVGKVAACVGRVGLFVLPGGPAGHALLEGDAEQAYAALTGLDARGGGSRLAVTAVARPGAAQIGAYREPAGDAPPRPRGLLRLRTSRSGRDASGRVRELSVDDEQLARGLLIGRYSDRCSLGGSGRNLSRVHALVVHETEQSLLVYDLASTNGVRPRDLPEGPSHPVVRLTATSPCLLGHFELSWQPASAPARASA